ncbi:MAG: hypothetical protein ACOYOD_14910 [Saprospiraceae bacterium]
MTTKLLTVLFCFALCLSCTGQGKPSGNVQHEAPAQQSPSDEEEIREMGLLKSAEDSGYPFMTLQIEFPERGFEEYFSVNLQEVGVDPGTISKWVGRYVEFYYTSKIANALMDLRMEGKSLLGMNPNELPEGLKKATGVLDCPDELSGDTPGTLSVTDPHEFSLSFEFFITQELVDAKGQIVEALYEERTENKVSKIKVLKK